MRPSTRSALSAPLLALALLLAAGSARAEDPSPAAESSTKLDEPLTLDTAPRYPPSSVRLKLAIGGIAIAGIAYAAAYGVTSNWPEVPGSSYLKAPVVGPWIALGMSGCASDDPNCGAGKPAGRGVLYVLDGIAQLGGLGLIAEAIFMKTEPTAAAPKRESRSFLGVPALSLRPFPVVTPTVTGVGLVGTF
ncbi:MAG: hypothetical protein U0359_42415 [Byssovorax sp.]